MLCTAPSCLDRCVPGLQPLLQQAFQILLLCASEGEFDMAPVSAVVALRSTCLHCCQEANEELILRLLQQLACCCAIIASSRHDRGCTCCWL